MPEGMSVIWLADRSGATGLKKANTYSATDAVPDPNNKRCFVANLRKVEGTKAIGGFAGQIDPASAANLDTASSEGLLGGLLQYLIGTPGDLARLLDATISTVRGADVKAWDDVGNHYQRRLYKRYRQYSLCKGGGRFRRRDQRSCYRRNE